MAELKGLVRALCEGDDPAKAAAARALGNFAYNNSANKAAIAKARGIPPLVDLLRDGSAKAKEDAARTLSSLACSIANGVLIVADGAISPLIDLLRDGSADAKLWAATALREVAGDNDANRVLIADAGGIPPLVKLLRDGSAIVKLEAALALRHLAYRNDNEVLIAEAGGIPPLVDLLRDGGAHAKWWAADALVLLARNHDANAVAIALAVGSLEALVQLARRGRLTVHNRFVSNAGIAAKRKAALVVAALLRDYVPEFKSAPRDIKTVIASYL